MEGEELYQALEALYAMRAVLAADAMNFFARFTAYLVACYLVGDKLTKFQIGAATVLYSVFSAGPIVGVYLANRHEVNSGRNTSRPNREPVLCTHNHGARLGIEHRLYVGYTARFEEEQRNRVNVAEHVALANKSRMDSSVKG